MTYWFWYGVATVFVILVIALTIAIERKSAGVSTVAATSIKPFLRVDLDTGIAEGDDPRLLAEFYERAKHQDAVRGALDKPLTPGNVVEECNSGPGETTVYAIWQHLWEEDLLLALYSSEEQAIAHRETHNELPEVAGLRTSDPAAYERYAVEVKAYPVLDRFNGLIVRD